MLPSRTSRRSRHLAGFTLVELIVVLLVLAILASIATVAFGDFTRRAHEARATADLRQLTTAVAAAAALEGTDLLTRDMVAAVMTEASGQVVDGFTAAAWQLGTDDQTPTGPDQFALGFDNGDSVVSSTSGTRAALVTAAPDGTLYAQVFTADAPSGTPFATASGTVTPAEVLGASATSGDVESDGSQGVPTPAPVTHPTVTDVTATGSDGAVTVSWSQATGATGYNAVATSTNGDTAGTCSTTGTSCQITGLTNGSTVTIVVTASFADAATTRSAGVEATPFGPAKDVRAVGGDGEVVVTWAPATGATGYTATAVTVATGATAGTCTTTATTCTMSGLSNDAALLVSVTATGVGGLSAVSAPVAATPTGPFKLVASDQADAATFGVSTAISGTTVVVGAYQAPGKVASSGAAYVYVLTSGVWKQQAKLVASDGLSGDMFGGSVSIDGDTAVIGAYGRDDKGSGSGAAYVFVRSGTTWTQQAKLLAPDGAATDYFGHSVSLDAGTAVISMHLDDDKGDGSGSAYVFVRSGTTWVQQAKIVPADGVAGGLFAQSVSIDVNTAIFGASGANAAYVYTRSGSTWTQQAKLTRGDALTGTYFGAAVALFGDLAVVGSYGDDMTANNAGAAFVFTRSGTTWTRQPKLLGQAAGDLFGISVATDATSVVVGTQSADRGGVNFGGAYVFTKTGSAWTEQQFICPVGSKADDYVGRSVAVAGGTIVVGAQGVDGVGSSSGAAYVIN